MYSLYQCTNTIIIKPTVTLSFINPFLFLDTESCLCSQGIQWFVFNVCLQRQTTCNARKRTYEFLSKPKEINFQSVHVAAYAFGLVLSGVWVCVMPRKLYHLANFFLLLFCFLHAMTFPSCKIMLNVFPGQWEIIIQSALSDTVWVVLQSVEKRKWRERLVFILAH